MANYTGSWSISGTTATYTIKDGDDTVKATITVTGLKSDVTKEALNNATTGMAVSSDAYETGGTVTLRKDFLGTSEVSMTATDAESNELETYKFALADDVVTSSTAKLTGAWTLPEVAAGADGTPPATNTATYKGGKEAYYTLDADEGTTVTYNAAVTNNTLATITGLKSGVTSEDLTTATDNSKTADKDGGKGTITLTDTMFTTSNVVLTGDKYSFGDLPTETTTFKTSGTAAYAWGEVSSNSAEYKETVNAFYTKNGKTINYTPEATRTVATISNLAEGVTKDNLTSATSGSTITLTNTMLSKDNTNKTTLTNATGEIYSLALKSGTDADAVPTSTTADKKEMWTATANTATEGAAPNGTATYANWKAEYFTLAGDAQTGYTVTYTKPAIEGDKIVEITGLTGLTDDVAYDAAGTTKPTGIGFTKGAPEITLADSLLSSTTGSVIVVSGGNYTLKIDDSKTWEAVDTTVSSNTGGYYWTVSSGDAPKTVTYQNDTKAGYKASDDNKTLTYTDKTTTKLFTISGLKDVTGGAKTTNGGSTTYEELAGITNPTGESKVFTLNENALYTDTTKPSGSATTPVATLTMESGVTGYTLAYAKKTGGTIEGEDVAAVNLWTATANVIEGDPATVKTYGTATYAEYKPEHFKVTDSNKISYVPQARTKKEDGTTDKDPLATISGLNIATAIATEQTAAPAGITLPTEENDTAIKLDGRVLPTVNRAETTLTSSTYTLDFDTTGSNAVVAYALGDKSWALGSTTGTAEYQQAATAGYTLDTATDSATKNKKITYTDATPITIATITGLKSDLTGATALNAKTGEVADVTVDETGQKITLNSTALGAVLDTTANSLTTTTTGYSLALGTGTDIGLTAAPTIAKNTITKTQADVKGNVTGYKIDNGAIKSVAATDVVLATITGLKDGGTAPTFKSDKITIARDQLAEKNVSLTTETGLESEITAIVDGYVLVLKNDATKIQLKGTATVSTANAEGKATITGTLDSYALDTSETGKSRKITYNEQANKTLATIEGLKANSDALALANGEIKLVASALDNKDIKLTNESINPTTYKLAWANSSDTTFRRDDGTKKDVWVSDATKGTATYKQVTEDYYDLATDGSKVEYNERADVEGKTYLTIGGLKKDTTALAVASDLIANITLSGKTVTLKAPVLNGETVTFKEGTGYKFAYAPDDTNDPPNKAVYTYALDYDESKGTATFKRGNEAYYKLNATNTELVYTAAKDPADTVVTVTGLSDEVAPIAANAAGVEGAASGAKWILGYSKDDPDKIITAVNFLAPANESDTTGEKVILNDATALNEKDVTLTNGSGFSYILEDATVGSIAPKDASLWVKDSSNYSYFAGKGAGYTLADDGSKLTYSKATKGDGTALATITGLNSKVTINDEGKIVNSSGAEVVTYNTNVITLKKDALGANDVKFVGDANSHTFALSGTPAGTSTETWSEKNGTVTYTLATGAFYQLNPGNGTNSGASYLPASTYVRYTAPVTYNVTISGLESSKVVATTDASGNITGGYNGISIDSATAEVKALTVGTGNDAKVVFDATKAEKGTVTVDEGLFVNTKGDIKVTSSNKAFGYNIDATPSASDSKVVKSVSPEWEVTNGKATYVKKIGAGKYYVDSNSSDKITYYKDKKVLSTLATINGLNKELTTFNAAVAGTSTLYDKDGDDSTTNDQGYSYMITMTKDLLASTEKSKVTKVTLTNGKDGNTPMQYSFELESGGTSAVAVPEVQKPKWVTKKGTATLQYETTEGFTLGDAKKATYHDVITYSADKWTPIVTLTGLNNLTNAKEKEYEVGGTSAADTPNAPASISEFALKGISAGVMTDASSGNTVSTITLSKNDLLTTSAIKLKNNTKAADWKSENAAKTGSWENTLKTTIGCENAQFVLSVDPGLKPTDYNPKWTYKSGTATLTSGTKAGYEQKSGNTDTVNYVKETVGVTIATISGLPKEKNKDYYAVGDDGKLYRTGADGKADLEKPAVTVSGVSTATVSGKTTATAATITFKKDGLAPLTSGTIKAKEKYVVLAVDDDAAPVYAEGDDGAWSIEKGKATLNRTVAVPGWNTAGKANETAMSISYVPDKDKRNNDNVETLATITGLNKDLTLKTVATYNAGNVTYAIYGATTTSGSTTTTATVLAAGADLNAYKAEIGKYIEFKTDVATGSTGTATLHNSVLSTSKVSIKSSTTARKYDLALASDVNQDKTKAENYWTVNGNKATFAYGKLAYYTPAADSKLVGSDGKTKLITSINYTKAPTAETTYFTLSGIKKGAQAGTAGTADEQKDFYISSGVTNASTKVTSDITVTLNSTAFDTTDAKKQSSTKVAISVPKGDYKGAAKLALGTGVTKATTEDSWTAGTGKATLERNVATSGYILSSDDKTITYGVSAKDAVNGVKQTKATALAVLNGVSSKAPAVPGADNVITIAQDQTSGKKITLKDNVNGGYTLKNTAAAPTVTLADKRSDSLKADSAWSTPKSGKVNLLGSVTTVGYTQSDNYNINYTAAAASGAKDKTLATVTGVKSSITAMTSTATGSVASMNGADLNNVVTVDGGGVISFDFDDTFHGTAAKSNSITGSAKDDTITVAGSYIAINPGKGNDLIDLGSGTGNSVIYASGDGNDVITGFNESQDKNKITLKNQKSVSVAWGDNDAVVTVDKGTITLKGFTGDSVTISGKTYTKPTSDLLLDDNYSMNAATDELSSIIKADTGSYTPYQFNDALKLTKEESFVPQIAYGSNKK